MYLNLGDEVSPAPSVQPSHAQIPQLDPGTGLCSTGDLDRSVLPLGGGYLEVPTQNGLGIGDQKGKDEVILLPDEGAVIDAVYMQPEVAGNTPWPGWLPWPRSLM